MGGLVLVVGPSGAGKDTLIGLARRALVADRLFVFPRRLVTRPKSSFEDHDTFTDDDFARGVACGEFALAWRAHGLGYALPKAAVQTVCEGSVVVANVSRLAVEDARERFACVGVVEVTAPEAVLRQRLAARSRDAEDIGARIARAAIPFRDPELRIHNDGSPEHAAVELVAFLRGFAAQDGPVAGRAARVGAAGWLTEDGRQTMDDK